LIGIAGDVTEEGWSEARFGAALSIRVPQA
jgi:hypothetical protein